MRIEDRKTGNDAEYYIAKNYPVSAESSGRQVIPIYGGNYNFFSRHVKPLMPPEIN
jgi:hypothetical protein